MSQPTIMGDLPWEKIRSLADSSRPTASWLGWGPHGEVVVKSFVSPSHALLEKLRALVGLRHPRLPAYEPLVVTENAVHLARPYYPGSDLTGKRFDSRVAWKEGAALLEGLSVFHAQGLRHGDLKPSNVLATADGWLLVDPCYDAEDIATLRYAAPEVLGLLKEPPGEAADLYSFGLLLAEVLTGQPVRGADNVPELLRQHLQPLSGPAPPGLESRFWDFLARLVHPDLQRRYRTSSGALQDMQALWNKPNLVLGRFDARENLAPPGFCARELELQSLLAGCRANTRQIIRITAPSGLGKSALARKVLEQLGEAVTVIWLSSDPEGRYEPYATLVSHLDATGASPADLVVFLRKRRHPVLIFDDLHWASQVTLEVIREMPLSRAGAERVSVDSTGSQGNSGSYQPALSADGQLVAFYSYASNLVAGDTNSSYDVFIVQNSLWMP